MIEFLKRLFGHQGSSATAKERLRLVLMTDHLELAPDMIEAMKHDLVDVISRYVEVDREKIEVNFERQDRTLAMLANIPILSVNRSNGKSASVEPATAKKDAKPAAGAKDGSAAPPTRKRRRRKKTATGASSAAPALPALSP
jgi:cell division topological specificity factor